MFLIFKTTDRREYPKSFIYPARIANPRQLGEASLHPSIRKYLDEARFKLFDIIDGNLNWNDYDMIFPVEDLYEGKI